MGNYTLGRLIGKGSFGKVYLASHKLTNGSKVRRTNAAFSQADIDTGRSYSSQLRRTMRTSPARSTTTANSYTPTLPACTRL